MNPKLEMFYSNCFTVSTLKLSTIPLSSLAFSNPHSMSGSPLLVETSHPFHKGPLCLLLQPVPVVHSVLQREGAVTAFSDISVSPHRMASGSFLHPLTFPQTFYHLLYSQTGQLLRPSSSIRGHSAQAGKTPLVQSFYSQRHPTFQELNEGILLGYS